MADMRQRNRISDSEAERRISDLENSGEFDGMSDDFKQLSQNDNQEEDTPHIDWSKYDEDNNPVDDYYKQKYAKKTAENLSDAEKSAAGGGKKDDDISGQEKSPDGPTSGFGGKAKGKLRGAINGWKKGGPTGGIVGLILGLFFGSSVLFAPMSLLANFGSILSNHFDLGNHHFLATGKSFVAAYFKGQTRNCSTSKIKCKFTSISERQLKSWEERGIKVDVGDGTKNALGRYKVRGLEFPNGRKVTSIFAYNNLKYSDAYAHSLLKRFPVRAGWLSAKSSINKSLKKLGAKTTKFVSSKLRDKSERVAANNEAMNSHTGATVDANGNTDVDAMRSRGNALAGDQTRAALDSQKGHNIAKGASLVGIATVPVELACITYTVIRAAQATTTLLWHEELVKFATPFFQASSQAKNSGVNGDLDAETAEYYADRLTQPVTQKEADADPNDTVTQEMVGKTAMDAKGMQEALHGDSLNIQGENNYAANYTGWAPGTQIWGSEFVENVRDTVGGDNIRVACVTAHVISYVGLAGCIGPQILACLGKLTIQIGAVYLFGDDALKYVAKQLSEPAMEYIAKANLTSELHGPQLGEALVSAHGVMSSYGDRASGFPVAADSGTAHQAYLDMITNEDYIVDKIATAKEEASRNQFDATNQYSFAGIVASKIAKTPWDGSLTSVFKNIAATVGAMPSTSIAGAAKEGLYQPIQIYESQERFEKSLANCTDPAMIEAQIPCVGQSGRSVPYFLPPITDCLAEELREGSDVICIETAIDKLADLTYDGKPIIDRDTGKPTDFSEYKTDGSGEYDNPFLMFMAYCGNDRKYPIGYTDQDILSDNGDWHTGKACSASTTPPSKGAQVSAYNRLAWMSYYYHMCIALYGSEENQNYCWDDAPAPSAPTPSTTPSTGTIAIDPGHSVPEISDLEPTTGATLSDYPNGVEVDDMWEAGQLIKAGLEEAGYTVKMLRNSKDEKVNFAERAERARGSAMVVSLHSNGGGDNWIAYQMVGGHRVGPSGTLTFENADTANKSKQCAEASAQEMGIGSQAGINFNGRSGIAPGDLPWVQLLSPDAPWIYHEVDPPDGGGGSSAMGANAIKKFADGVVAGLKKCNISAGAETPADPAITASIPTANDLAITKATPIENPLVGTLFAGLPLGFHSYTSRPSANNNIVLPEFNFAATHTRYWENIAGI